MGILGTEWIPVEEIRFLVAALTTFIIWRPLGSFMQQYVTTRPPTDKQLEGAIRAGKDLLSRYAESRNASPTVTQRLWNSGMFHVMAGSTVTALIVYGLSTIFHWGFAVY